MSDDKARLSPEPFNIFKRRAEPLPPPPPKKKGWFRGS